MDMTNNLWANRFSEEEMLPIVQALLDLAHDNAVRSELPDIDQNVGVFIEAAEMGDTSALEAATIKLYLALHSAGYAYSSYERDLLTLKNGYSCISGGLSPLMLAGKYIRLGSVVADLGAGNGLQGLLLQRLYPHKKTLQIELSSEMVRMGRIFQGALGIGDDRMEWINADIADVSLESVDFVYLYRPARPSDSGSGLYRAIALKLAANRKPVVIFSVADCLSGFLDKSFSVSYTDGHLTCFSKK
jgi:hypothetical protein